MALDLFTAIQTRRSVRRYAPQPVPPEVIERLLAASLWAPSAHNRQPWRFAVLPEAAGRERLAAAMGEQLRQDRRSDGDPEAVIDQDLARSQARLTAAPLAVVVCLSMTDMDVYPDTRRKKAEYTMAVQSTAMAVQNLLLAAHGEGLGACWMCAPLFCREVVRVALELPADWEPQAVLTMGYPAEAGRVRPRRPVSAVSVWR